MSKSKRSKKAVSAMLATLAVLSPIMQSSAILAEENSAGVENALNNSKLIAEKDEPIVDVDDKSKVSEVKDTTPDTYSNDGTNGTVGNETTDGDTSGEGSGEETGEPTEPSPSPVVDNRPTLAVPTSAISLEKHGFWNADERFLSTDAIVTLNSANAAGYQHLYVIELGLDESIPTQTEGEVSASLLSKSLGDLIEKKSITLKEKKKYAVAAVWSVDTAKTTLSGYENNATDKTYVNFYDLMYSQTGSGSSYVLDNKGSSISNIKLNGSADISNWLTSNSATVSFDVGTSISGLTKVTVNDKEVTGPNYSCAIDLPAGENSSFPVTIKTIVKSGKEVSSTINLKVDKVAPVVSGVTVSGLTENNGKYYMKESVGMSLSVTENGSGISRTMINGEQSDNSKNIVIKSLGDEVKIYDVAGNFSTYTGMQLLEKAGYSRSDIVVSNGRSDITGTTRDPDYTNVVDNVTQNWYKGNPEVEFHVFNNTVSKVDITINGVSVNGGNQSITEDGIYRVSTFGYSGRVEVTCKTTDVFGVAGSKTVVLYLDTSRPVINNVALEGSGKLSGSTIYASSSYRLTGNIQDSESGAKGYSILRDGVVVNTSEGSKIDYTLSVSGSYTLEVTDKVGNTNSYPLSNYTTGGATSFVFDYTSPTIEATVDGNAISMDWYSSNKKILLSVSDENLEAVTVNGNAATKEGEFYTINANLEGQSTYAVAAVDKSGNRTEKNFTIKIDKTAPNLDSISATAQGKLVGSTYYTSGNINISGAVTDRNSGLKKISVEKDGIEVWSTTNGTVSHSFGESGIYVLKATDNAGNTSSVNICNLLSATSIVVDKSAPKITTKINDTDTVNDSYFGSAPVVSIGVVDEDSNLDTVKVNGVEVTLVNGVYNYNTSDDGEGKVIINIEATDKAGNTSTKRVTLNNDFTAPSLDGLKFSATGVKVGETMFVKDEKIVLSGDIVDSGAGVKEVRITAPDGSSVVENSENKRININYTFKDSGIYTITAIDKLGNSITKSFNDLLNNGTTEFVFDTEGPVITGEAPEGDYNNWYKTAPTFDVTVTDDNLESVTITGADYEDLGNGVYRINTSFNEGLYTVQIKAKDKSGNETVKSFRLGNDISAPDLSGLRLTPDRGGKLVGNTYYVGNFCTLSGSVSDVKSGVTGCSGIKDVTVNGKSIYNKATGNVDYTFSETGTYSLVAEDNVGNSVEISLNELVEGGDLFEFDNNGPVVSIKVDGQDIVNGKWYDLANAPVIELSVEDAENNLDTVSASVKGHLKEDKDLQFVNNRLTINTADYATDGNVFIGVTASDYSSNTTSVNCNVNIDNTPVDLSTLSITGDPNNGLGFVGDGCYYAKGRYTLSGILSDGTGSGINTIEIIKDGVVLEYLRPNVSFTFEDSGIYTIRVTDKVGNVSTKNLATYLDEDCISFVFDNDAPNITFTHDGNAVEIDGKKWFKDEPHVFANVQDENLESATAVIVAGGVKLPTENLVVGNNPFLRTDKEGKVQITVNAKDHSGNTTNVSYEIYNDFTEPDLSDLRIDERGQVLDGVYYGTGTYTIKGNVTDSGSGVKFVKILKDGKEDAIYENGRVSYKFSESGVYDIVAEDMVGNTIKISANKLLDESTSSFVFDNDPAVLSATINGKSIEDAAVYRDSDGNSWFKDAPVVSLRIEDANLKSFKVNDVEHQASELVNGFFDVDTSGQEGLVTIHLESLDKAGNTSEETYTLYNDFTKPELGTISAVFDPNGDDDDDYKYISGTVSFEGESVDGHNGTALPSGVQKIELVKDGVVLDGSLSDNTPIDSDGNYSLRITDNVGNFEDFELNHDQLLHSKSSSIRFDSENPVISDFTASKFIETLNQNGKVWYRGTPNMSFNVEDKYVKSVVATINDNEELSANDKGTYTLDTSKYENQEVKLKVVVTDKAGNSSEKEDSYWQDNTAPFRTREAIVDMEPDNEKSGKVFYKKSPSVQFDYNDGEGVGMGTYILSGYSTPENTTGTYSNLINGEYSLVVKDLLGNETEPETLAQLLGWKSNTLVIDGEAPNAVISRSSPQYNDGSTDWYNTDFDVNVDLSDNVGLDRAELKINGEVVDSFATVETEEKSANLKANTSRVQPDNAGGYSIEVIVYDNAGNSYTARDFAKIDKTAPVVTRFVISGTVNVLGKDTGGSDDKYGFFFDGKGSIEVNVQDDGVTSGIHSIYTKLDNQTQWVEHQVNSNTGSASVTISVPESYKGMVYAYAVDNATNKGEQNQPDGLVSEATSTHINSQRIDITLPQTGYSDSNGLPLYSGDTSANVVLGCDWSGIQKLEWGINDRTYETLTSFTNVQKTDKNLSLSMSKVMQMEGNANNLKLWVKVTDMTNHVSENFKEFSIDKDVPVIQVTWNNTEGDNYYNSSRVANVFIRERNFDPSKVSISGTSGSLSGWSQSGDGWSATISCDSDNDYNFTIDATDRAGNRAAQFSSGQFTVDKTAPVMQVSWDNNSAENGKYYKASRTATITVTEHNFDASRMRFEGNGSLSGWSNNGDVHTAYVTFDKDGEYSFSISGSDLADNPIGQSYSSGDFVIDTSKPSIKITGVSEGTSYKDTLTVGVDVGDSYVDLNRTYAILRGKNHEEVKLDGVLGISGGHYEFSNFPREEMTDDVYTLEVHVVDMAGNETTDMVIFSVNRFGSKFGFRDADILGNYVREAQDIVISETNVDQLDINAIQIVVTRDGEEIEVPSNLINITEEEIEGKYVYTYTVDKSLFDGDGVYSIQVFSRSLDGTDYTSAAESYDFILDTTEPEIIVSGIETDGRYQEYSKPVAIEIRDISGVESVGISINGKEIEVSPDSEGIYHVEIEENSQTQDLAVTAIDLAGNKATIEVNNFLVTSNPWAFILNQWWFWTAIAAVGASITGMLVFLLKRRKDETNQEDESLRTSERVTSSSSISDSSSTSSGSSKRSTSDDDSTASMQDEADNEKTDIIDE